MKYCSIVLFACLCTFAAVAQDETLLLQSPSISENHVTFAYAGDVWIANRDGSHPRRLTADPDQEQDPILSPDGKWVAYTARYAGNNDIYVVPATGGTPKRMTWHSGGDQTLGWSSDSKRILFNSDRLSNPMPYGRLFTVGLNDVWPQPLPMPTGEDGSFSPNGKQIAYTPLADPVRTWKRYRGGLMSKIWVFNLKSHDHVEIPGKGSNNLHPQWLGDHIYFLSDRNHTMNLFSYHVKSKAVKQLTHHDDFDVKSLSAGAGVLVYDQGGRLHVFNPETSRTETLKIKITDEMPATRPRYADGSDFLQSAAVSSTGLRAVVEARGEIFTVPLKNGVTRNITNSPGTNDRAPAWSPDGKTIAFFTERDGEYGLGLSDQKGHEALRFIELPKKNFYYEPLWSPDSKNIAFTDKQLNLWYVSVEDGKAHLVDTSAYDHPTRSIDPAWSPDSQWLTYSKRQVNHLRAIFVYNLAEKSHHQITDNAADAVAPCFTRDGKHLYFSLSTDLGLNVGWLDMSSFDKTITRNIYVAVLNKNDPSPFAPKSDEEANDPTPEPAQPEAEGEEADGVKVVIDFDGLDQRILAVPVGSGFITNLAATDSHLYYLKPPEVTPFGFATADLLRFDLKEHKEETWMSGVSDYQISADGKKIMYGAGPTMGIVDAAGKASMGDGALSFSDMKVYVDPKAEWRQIFNEAWRIERDFFYVENMHGLDWEATRRKYEAFLPHVAHRNDLNVVMADLIGEMVVGHNNIGGGDYHRTDQVPVGMLGADYEVHKGRYRFKTIYQGQNWNPDLQAPLTQPGLNISEGDYLLEVNGKELTSQQNLYSFFQQTAGKQVELTVNDKPTMEGARSVVVTPLRTEYNLRHFSWVEGNRKRVEELSGGQLAYAYMTNTSFSGYDGFNRGYFTNLKAKGLVLDERMNGGGFVADYVIQMLSRQTLFYWATREGEMFSSPNASIKGPQVMLIDEYAGSGGDAMPAMFRRANLGKLVGTTTWGGLVGIYDYPALMDGGGITAPRVGVVSPDGEYEIENVGVPPDVEVIQNPKLVIQGHDPQLEKAVAILMEELKNHKDPTPPRPADPNRVK